MSDDVWVKLIHSELHRSLDDPPGPGRDGGTNRTPFVITVQKQL